MAPMVHLLVLTDLLIDHEHERLSTALEWYLSFVCSYLLSKLGLVNFVTFKLRASLQPALVTLTVILLYPGITLRHCDIVIDSTNINLICQDLLCP